MKYLLLTLLLVGCGTDTDCFDGCAAEPESTRSAEATATAGQGGAPGQGCVLEPANGQAVLTCGDVSFTIQNGLQGIQGLPGAVGPQGEIGDSGASGTDAAIVVIDPCGPERADGKDDKILALGGGVLLGVSYKHPQGKTSVFAIAPGFHKTDDGTDCRYAADANGEVTW